MKWIEKIIDINEYKIICLWNDGVQRNLNLERFIFEKSEISSYSYLRLLENFIKVKCDGTTLYWENLIKYKDFDGTMKDGNLDIAPEILYELSVESLKKVV